MPITIRSLNPDEYFETSRITLECMRQDYRFFPRAYLDSLTVETELAMFESWVNEEETLAKVFGAFNGGQMVGYIAVSRNLGEPEGYDGEVNNLFVRPGHRGEGIGLLLLQIGLEYLRGLGYESVIIYNYHPSASNAFYRHLGGQVVYHTLQMPDGMFEVDVDVFGWQIDEFLSILCAHLEKYPHLRV